jgi:Spy/CpxP family protein refolding chaperone
MKKFIALSLGLLAAAAPLSAQDDNQPQPDRPGMGGPPWMKQGKKHGPPGVNLSPEERRKLAAAREKADTNSTVQSLRAAKEQLDEQLASAMRSAMLAADPSLGPTLDKIKAARDRAKDMKQKFRSLTPEQRKQLKAARMAAKDDPAVQAAREKLRAAQGPEAKRAAAKEMHEAMKAAMLKADPSLAPLLEQLGPPGPGGPDGEDGPEGPLPPDADGPPHDPTF